jgi:type IV secretory pathway VirB10-like protein
LLIPESMVRSIAFASVAVLVVAAAGTGAYLAVRHNEASAPTSEPIAAERQPAVATGQPSHTEVEIEAPAVDVTEETLTPAVPRADVAEEVREETRPDGGASATEPDPTPATVPAAPRDTTASSRTSNLPDVEGWSLSDTWPSRQRETEPTQLTLASIPSSALGVGLDTEERPLIVEELIISADSVVGLQVDTPVSTEDARVEDDVEARVTRDVLVGDHIAIPAGTRVMGSVGLVEQVGKVRGASRLGVRFHTVVLDDGVEVPLMTETVYREGKGKGSASAGKIGGAAVGGAILGAIFGGRQGAAIGGAAGAAGGTAAAMAGDGQPATLPAGATVTVRLSQPATVTVERYPFEP